MNPTHSAELARACPVCRVPLVSERGAEPWCERCAYGIDVFEPPPGTNWWRRRTGAVSHRIAYRLTMSQFRQLAGGSPFARHASPVVEAMRPPRPWGWARILTLAVAVVMYALIALLAYAGVRLVLFDFPNLTAVLGVLLLLIAIYLLPRFPRLPRYVEVLSRDQAPTLFALIDRVAAGLGTKTPHIVGVFPWFNAYTDGVGLRRRRLLMLGLALFGALDPQQRVALLAHELGHFRNGDIRRGLVTEPAMTTLGRLSHLFTGGSTMRPRAGLPGFVEPIVTLVMGVVSAGFYAAHLALLAVMLRDSQRREYHADQRAARLAGTTATAQLLDLLSSDADSVIASRSRAKLMGPAWQEAAAELLGPDRAGKIHRLRQLSTRRDVSLWTTHPPAGLRAWLIEAELPQEPALVLTQVESDQIDAELARHYQQARRDLAQSRI